MSSQLKADFKAQWEAGISALLESTSGQVRAASRQRAALSLWVSHVAARRYIGSNRAYVGVMAQEVQSGMPKAVMRDRDGSLPVFYEKIGIKFQTYEQWIAAGARVPKASRASP